MKKTSDSTQSPDTLKLKKHRLIIAVLSVLAVLLLLAGLARLIGPPLLDAVRNKESFRQWIDAQGPWKYLIMVGIMTAQIIVALVPGAPVEMAAGYAFGLWGGCGAVPDRHRDRQRGRYPSHPRVRHAHGEAVYG